MVNSSARLKKISCENRYTNACQIVFMHERRNHAPKNLNIVFRHTDGKEIDSSWKGAGRVLPRLLQPVRAKARDPGRGIEPCGRNRQGAFRHH